jgi:hypothetical protein
MPIEQDVGCTSETNLDIMEENLLTLPEIKTQFLSHSFCSLVTVLNTLLCCSHNHENMTSLYYIHWSVAENVCDIATLVIMGAVRNTAVSVEACKK